MIYDRNEVKVKQIRRLKKAYLEGKLGAMDKFGDCLYRNNKGRFCAVGYLLSNKTLNAIGEKRMNDSLFNIKTFIPNILGEIIHDTKLEYTDLCDLQHAHDLTLYSQGKEVQNGKPTDFYWFLEDMEHAYSD